MNKVLQNIRKNYFTKLVEKHEQNLQFILLIHVVPDVIEMLDTISSIGNIALIIAVPYSSDETSIKQLRRYKIIHPSLDELLTPSVLNKFVLSNVDKSKKTIILEIGGYFAKGLNDLAKAFQGNLLGVVEDTEAGHRRYELESHHLPCPVVSVARSSLKEAEDMLVGRSCAYAIETILRKVGYVFNGQICLVLGYGKIGRGVAKALKQQNASIMIYDTDPMKRILALTEGYQVPTKEYAFKNAGFIFGATGNTSLFIEDFSKLKSGVILVSCSSKRIEFDLTGLSNKYQKKVVFEEMDAYCNNNHTIYVIGNGEPVNFVSEKCLVGPIIYLIQGEMLLAVSELLNNSLNCSIHQVNQKRQNILANLWLEHFCDEEQGYCRYAT